MTVAVAKKRIRSWDIAESLRQNIQRKSLAPDTPIMSTRQIANHFKASLVTANRALNSLVDEGVLYRVQGSGSFVKGKSKPQRRLVIGLMESIVNQDRNGFYAAHGVFIDSCLDELREKRCDVRYFSYQNLAEQKFPKESLDGLDGLIVNSSCIDKKTLVLLNKFTGPITLYANDNQVNLPFNQALPDLDRGFKELFSKLDRAKVDGIITMSVRHTNADAREKHFIDAALNAGLDSNNKCNTLKTDKCGKAGYIVSSQKRQQQRSVANEIQPAFPRTKIHYLLFIAKEIIKIKDGGWTAVIVRNVFWNPGYHKP